MTVPLFSQKCLRKLSSLNVPVYKGCLCVLIISKLFAVACWKVWDESKSLRGERLAACLCFPRREVRLIIKPRDWPEPEQEFFIQTDCNKRGCRIRRFSDCFAMEIFDLQASGQYIGRCGSDWDNRSIPSENDQEVVLKCSVLVLLPCPHTWHAHQMPRSKI